MKRLRTFPRNISKYRHQAVSYEGLDSHWLLKSIVALLHAAWPKIIAAILAAFVMPTRTNAITINMTYFNEGDPVPHAENPSWDPDGTILKAHFQAAKAIWENLLPGGGSYDLQFEWDDDIDPLGLTSPDTQNPGDFFIEINPTKNWFADPTPAANTEFATTPTQTNYGQLSASDKSTYFPVASPPSVLETRFDLAGQSGPAGLGGYDSHDGVDLLTVILHEMGHVFAFNTLLPGNWPIDPQHVGGLQDVWVLGAFAVPGGAHLAGEWTVPGFLMNHATPSGQRILPSATDVLVIAEDQNISQVHLARVDRINGGVWSNASSWIGGAVPDITQDVYIRTPGDMAVTLDVDAQAKNIYAGVTASLDVQNHRLTVPGTLDYNAGSLHAGAGGVIDADKIIADQIVANAGSLVRFNSYKRGGLSGTTVSFGGSVAIGSTSGPAILDPFAPTDYTIWNIGEDLTIGDKKTAMLTINDATWTVGGDLLVGGEKAGTLFINSLTGTPPANSTINIGGNLEARGSGNFDTSEVLVRGQLTAMNITGHIIAGPRGIVRFRNQNPPEKTYEVAGGFPTLVDGAVQYALGGTLLFETESMQAVNVKNATIEVEGGAGPDVPGGTVTFRGTTNISSSMSSSTTIHAKSGRLGSSILNLPGLDVVGNGGQIRFEDTADAGVAMIVNDGVSVSSGGTGGRTVFTNNSRASSAEIHNHGATHNKGGGGATHFLDQATAQQAKITNHGVATFVYSSMSGQTVFYDSSNAGSATIENESGSNIRNGPGRTEFRDDSSAAFAVINNRGNATYNAGAPGVTAFYDNATAADAIIKLYEGYNNAGRTEFHGNSNAGHAQISTEVTNPPGGSTGGGGEANIVFHDDSTADHAAISLRAQACCSGIEFRDNAKAGSATIILRDAPSRITFSGNATAEDANLSIEGESELAFLGQSKAGTAEITMSNRARGYFRGGASAELSTIYISGAPSPGPNLLGGLNFLDGAKAEGATIVAYGGSVAGAPGARVTFASRAHAENATITAGAGLNGGAGAFVSFNSGATGDSAKLIAEAGSTIDFGDQRTFGGTQVGSIEGAGTFVLNGSLLTTGNLNLNTLLSGPITNGNLAGGALTKVGTGQLTLAGANTYAGLTTVSAGTVTLTGSIAGGAVVGSGGTLNGTGSIAGTVTVDLGGVFAPGTSPASIAIGGLKMMAGGTLNFEIGDTASDHIVLNYPGNVSLAGILNVSLIGGFTPALGQTFPLVEGVVGSITGAFNSVVVPTFNGRTFAVMQSPGSLLLQVVPAGSGSGLDLGVPEPGGWQLALAATLLFVFSRASLQRRTTGRAASCFAR